MFLIIFSYILLSYAFYFYIYLHFIYNPINNKTNTIIIVYLLPLCRKIQPGLCKKGILSHLVFYAFSATHKSSFSGAIFVTGQCFCISGIISSKNENSGPTFFATKDCQSCCPIKVWSCWKKSHPLVALISCHLRCKGMNHKQWFWTHDYASIMFLRAFALAELVSINLRITLH